MKKNEKIELSNRWTDNDKKTYKLEKQKLLSNNYFKKSFKEGQVDNSPKKNIHI